MPYIIKSTIKDTKSGKLYSSFLKEHRGAYNLMTSGADDAKQYETRGGAKLAARNYFPGEKRITIEKFES